MLLRLPGDINGRSKGHQSQPVTVTRRSQTSRISRVRVSDLRNGMRPTNRGVSIRKNNKPPGRRPKDTMVHIVCLLENRTRGGNVREYIDLDKSSYLGLKIICYDKRWTGIGNVK